MSNYDNRRLVELHRKEALARRREERLYHAAFATVCVLQCVLLGILLILVARA